MLPLVSNPRARQAGFEAGASEVLWSLAALDPGHDAGQYIVVWVLLHSVLYGPKGVHSQAIRAVSERAVAHAAHAKVTVEGVEGVWRQGHGLCQPVILKRAYL